MRISFNKSESHGAAANSVDKPDKSLPTTSVSLYVADMFRF